MANPSLGHMQSTLAVPFLSNRGQRKTRLQGSFEVVYRLQMGPVITQIKFSFLSGENGSSQISHSDLLANRVFLRRCWCHRASPSFLSEACSCLTLYLFFFPASFCCDCVEKLSELSVCIRLHLSPFLACICNQIFESPTGHEDDLTVFLISCPSQQPSSSITHPPPTPHLPHPSWPHELMSKWHLEIMNVADHQKDAEIQK